MFLTPRPDVLTLFQQLSSENHSAVALTKTVTTRGSLCPAEAGDDRTKPSPDPFGFCLGAQTQSLPRDPPGECKHIYLTVCFPL